MNYCKDCKHCVPARIVFIRFSEFDKCRHTLDPVSGKVKHFCEIERKNWGLLDVCGPDAKYFEPKPAKVGFWKRLFA